VRRLNVALARKARFTWHLAHEFALHYSCPEPHWMVDSVGIHLTRTPHGPSNNWQPFIGQERQWTEAVMDRLGRIIPKDHHIQSHHTFPITDNPTNTLMGVQKMWFIIKYNDQYAHYHDEGAILIDRFMGYLWHIGTDNTAKENLQNIDANMAEMARQYAAHYRYPYAESQHAPGR
jgi:hypothetical protein